MSDEDKYGIVSVTVSNRYHYYNGQLIYRFTYKSGETTKYHEFLVEEGEIIKDLPDFSRFSFPDELAGDKPG
jgi:hypothetical protein